MVRMTLHQAAPARDLPYRLLPELRKLEDILKAESTLLAALCQGVLTGSQRTEMLCQLTAYRWQNKDHQLIFEALRELRSANARQLRDELPGQLTRRGFPDVDLEPLFHLRSLSAAEALEFVRALLAHTKRLRLNPHPT